MLQRKRRLPIGSQSLSGFVRCGSTQYSLAENVYNMAALRANAGLNSSSDNYRPRRALPECAQRWSNIRRDGKRQSATGGAHWRTAGGDTAPPAELAEQPVSLKNIDYQPSRWCWRQKTYASQHSTAWKNESAILANAEYSGGQNALPASDRSYWDDQLQLNVNAPLYRAARFLPRCNRPKGNKKSLPAGRTGKTGCAATSVCGICQRTGARGREEAGLAQSESAHKREMCTKMNINWANAV